MTRESLCVIKSKVSVRRSSLKYMPFRMNRLKSQKVIQILMTSCVGCGKVQVGIDQEKAQSEKDSHSKNRGGKKPN